MVRVSVWPAAVSVMKGDSAALTVVAVGSTPLTYQWYRDSVLIAGDMVLPRISTNVSVQPSAPDADPLGSFIEALNRFKKLDPGTLVLPSHGLPFYGLHERIAALNDHHVARLDELIAACATPQTGAQLLPVLFNRPLDAQQTVFAMGETLSHINYLHRRGELSRQRDADGPYRYARVSGDKA